MTTLINYTPNYRNVCKLYYAIILLLNLTNTNKHYCNQSKKKDKSVGVGSEIININEENYQRGIENW